MFKIPRKIDQLLPAAAVERMVDLLHQPELAAGVKEALGKVGVKDLNPLDRMHQTWRQTRMWLESFQADVGADSTVASGINATGCLFHCAGSLPTSSVVAHGVAKSLMAFRDAQSIEAKAYQVATDCFGSAQAAYVQSLTAALIALVQTLRPRELVVATSDILRIAGVGDIRATLSALGCELSVVGAVNGASSDEWQQALHSSNQLLVQLSPNSLCEQEQLAMHAEAGTIARGRSIPIVELLLDGVISQTLADATGMPLITDRQDSGKYLIVPTDIMLGGPPGALLLGDGRVEQVRQTAALCGLSMAAPAVAATTTAMQLQTIGDEIDAGVMSLLLANPENLSNRATRLAVQLDGLGPISKAEPVQRRVAFGPTPWNRYSLENWAVELTPAGPADEILSKLAGSLTSARVWAANQGQKVQLDLRFVPANCDFQLVEPFHEPGADCTASAKPDTESEDG